jgi:hypothetical protein
MSYLDICPTNFEVISDCQEKNLKPCIRELQIVQHYIFYESCTYSDVLSLNNFMLGDFVDPIEFEIKDTTDTDRSASYLDLHIEIVSEGRLRTKFYDKRDDFNFPIVTFQFKCVATFHQHLHMEYISLS